MSIQSHLNHLRSKPDHIKKHIAFWSALGMTLVISLFWVASFTSVGSNSEQAIANAVKQAGTPSQSLVASVGGFFGDIKDMIFTPKKVTYVDVQVTPGK